MKSGNIISLSFEKFTAKKNGLKKMMSTKTWNTLLEEVISKNNLIINIL